MIFYICTIIVIGLNGITSCTQKILHPYSSDMNSTLGLPGFIEQKYNHLALHDCVYTSWLKSVEHHLNHVLIVIVVFLFQPSLVHS